METQVSLKERIYDELIKNYSVGTKIILVPFYKKVGCSIAYLSSLIRYGRAAGFFDIDIDGDYITTKELPDNYNDFRENMNEKSREIRAQASGKPISKKTIKEPKPTEYTKNEFEGENLTLNELTLIDKFLKSLKEVLKKKRKAEEKNKTLIKYIKKLKAENEKLIEEMENMS